MEERVGLAMKHSGVAITITSVTDFLAFGIGTFSSLPSFSSFCAYAAIGIVAVFINIASFFLAWLILDEQRIEARRDAFFCCWKKTDSWIPNKFSQKSFQEFVFQKYSTVLSEAYFKMVGMFVTVILLIISCLGAIIYPFEFEVGEYSPNYENRL